MTYIKFAKNIAAGYVFPSEKLFVGIDMEEGRHDFHVIGNVKGTTVEYKNDLNFVFSNGYVQDKASRMFIPRDLLNEFFGFAHGLVDKFGLEYDLVETVHNSNVRDFYISGG